MQNQLGVAGAIFDLYRTLPNYVFFGLVQLQCWISGLLVCFESLDLPKFSCIQMANL